jgi:hypothetical protein
MVGNTTNSAYKNNIADERDEGNEINGPHNDMS